jgi:rhodanese-related sulfurtransferase
MVGTIERIRPQQAQRDVQSGALLVCAYDSEEKFRQNCLEGSISLSELRNRQESMDKDQELIFYCA